MTLASRMYRGIGRRTLLAGAGGLVAAPVVVRAQGPSSAVALVIGNSKYRWEASLPNVKRDAPDVAKRFQALGLKTELLQDASQDAMRAAVDKFASAARGANLAAFYFAGHGASWDKDTYLVPEDADLGNPNTVQTLLPVRTVSAAVKEANNRLLVFDNCRNNPADGWRQREARASSRITKTELAAAALQGPNTLVLFSTAPGRVAADGPAGENSPFATVILRQLSSPTVDLRSLPEKLRRDLLIATEGRQVLWDQSTFDQPFMLGNSQKTAAAGAAPAAASQLVELPNAYAFAREKGLLLPPGLVALRPANGSADGTKIGSFATTIKTTVGGSLYSEALLLIVLSAPDPGVAQIIICTKDWQSVGDGADGKVWRYSTGTLSGSRLGFGFFLGNAAQELPQDFKWNDANSGTYTGIARGGGYYHFPFTRLD